MTLSVIIKLSLVGSDYDAPDGTNFVIAAGTAQACVNFTIIDDDALESNESFTLHLSITTLGVNTGGLIYSSVIIIDNDAAGKLFVKYLVCTLCNSQLQLCRFKCLQQ